MESEKSWGRPGVVTRGKYACPVQDILYDHGLLPEEFRLGWCEKALFIGESDWIYRCCFAGEKAENAGCFSGDWTPWRTSG